MSQNTRVLVADDHGVVRKGLRFLLQTDPGIEVVGEASDGREAVRMTEQLAPDVVVMDITMPQLNGIDAASQIVKRTPEVGIIMLSMHCDETFLVRALAAGAQGYLLKDCAEADLLQAVKAVANKKLFFSPTITQTLLEDYMRQMQSEGLEDSYDLLTDREKEVLQLLAEGKSNKEAAATAEREPLYGGNASQPADAEAQPALHRRHRAVRGPQANYSVVAGSVAGPSNGSTTAMRVPLPGRRIDGHLAA